MTPDTLQSWSAFIAGVGFPVFVAVYLLVTFRSTIRDNTEAITALTTYLKVRDQP